MDAECRFFYHRPTNLNDTCKSDNINVHDVCFTLFHPSVDRVQDTIVQYKKKKKSKKLLIFDKKVKQKIKQIEEKNESAISRQTDAQRKMNARRSFETEGGFFLFCLALAISNQSYSWHH